MLFQTLQCRHLWKIYAATIFKCTVELYNIPKVMTLQAVTIYLVFMWQIYPLDMTFWNPSSTFQEQITLGIILCIKGDAN